MFGSGWDALWESRHLTPEAMVERDAALEAGGMPPGRAMVRRRTGYEAYIDAFRRMLWVELVLYGHVFESEERTNWATLWRLGVFGPARMEVRRERVVTSGQRFTVSMGADFGSDPPARTVVISDAMRQRFLGVG